ncbi:unnamed protein product, partial [Medioppia subpectinata]
MWCKIYGSIITFLSFFGDCLFLTALIILTLGLMNSVGTAYYRLRYTALALVVMQGIMFAYKMVAMLYINGNKGKIKANSDDGKQYPGSFIVEMIISCLMCGRIGVNVGKISAALNTICGSHWSDSEYKELVLFGNALRNTPTVGFTIGGFAAINKSTLISAINKNLFRRRDQWIDR